LPKTPASEGGRYEVKRTGLKTRRYNGMYNGMKAKRPLATYVRAAFAL
jgi:hypothetical protein